MKYHRESISQAFNENRIEIKTQLNNTKLRH